MKIGFSKKSSAVPDESAVVRKLSLVGIFGNILLSAFKLIAGFLGNSAAMISDAVHSMSDVVATLVAYFGVKASLRPADKKHPYGHDRMECIAAIILGLILIITGILIGKSGIETIISGSYESIAAPEVIALVAAIVSIVVKEAMYWYTRHWAVLINSQAFMADAWHHRSDAFSSIGALAGICGAMLGFKVLDSVASVVICVLILKVAVGIILDAIERMIDTFAGDEFEGKIRQLVEADSKIARIDLLHTRTFGSKVYIDLEIAVDGKLSLEDAHAISSNIHDEIEQAFPEVKHVMIHVNPA